MITIFYFFGKTDKLIDKMISSLQKDFDLNVRYSRRNFRS